MSNYIKEILDALELYFVYIYPGFVTIYIYKFITAKKFKYNKESVLISLIVSYIYIIVYRFFIGYSVNCFFAKDFIYILLASIVLPIVWLRIYRSKLFEALLRWLKINSSVEDNVWDYIRYRTDKQETITLKIFLDDKSVMYEGKLRYYQFDEDDKAICLSAYRRYLREDNKFTCANDYANDNSRWVMIKISGVTRVEICYDSQKN